MSYRKGKHSYSFYLSKKFQGLGFMFSANNPYVINEYILFEFRFLWFKCWYDYDINKDK